MDTIRSLVQVFAPVFSAPSFSNGCFLMLAWLKTSGRARISNFLRAGRFMSELVPRRKDGRVKHFSALYRFFTEAEWSLDALGRRLALLLTARLYESRHLVVLVDDTVQPRGGPKILGAGMHYDASASTYGGEKGRRSRFTFGLNFVTVAVWIPVGFLSSGGMAVPVLFRLYRSKKTCPESKYRKRTELAAEMLEVLRDWWPEREMIVVGDHTYSSETVIDACDETMEVGGRLPWDAALYDPEFEQKKQGRPRLWGPRLHSPKQLVEDPSYPWRICVLKMYGKRIELRVKTLQAQWKSAPADRVLTVVVTRDPSGHFDDECFFRLQAQASVEEVLLPISRRWSLEQCYRDCKQHLRIDSVQNGFCRGETRADRNQPGPAAPQDRDPKASKRTVPFGMISYGFVVAWYLGYANPGRNLLRAQNEAPWYTHKVTLSFRDMLAAFRRQMNREGLWQTHPETGFGKKKPARPPDPDRRAA
mgnify:CR=1 FL=1